MESEMRKKKNSENRRKFIRQASKIVHEWNGHLEIFSRPKPIENSRPCLQSLGAPVLLAARAIIGPVLLWLLLLYMTTAFTNTACRFQNRYLL